MPEQDTSKWELEKSNEFIGYSEAKTRLIISPEISGKEGIWFQLMDNSNSQNWYSWIPPEVAEAMGTMLLYAAQEWRQKYGETDPR